MSYQLSESCSVSPVAEGWMEDEGYWMRRLEDCREGSTGGLRSRMSGWVLLVGYTT